MFKVLNESVTLNVNNRGRAANLLNVGTKKRKAPTASVIKSKSTKLSLWDCPTYPEAFESLEQTNTKRKKLNPQG